MARVKQSGARPSIACEITSDRVVAARLSEKAQPELEMFTTRQLDPATLVPGLTAPNIQDTAALRSAISGALAGMGAASKDVIAILPDAAIRVLLLEFDTLPAKALEAEAVVRFRLKKSLPFDADTAALSYEVRQANGTVQVVAAISPREVVDEYETAFRDAGYAPGLVLPSSLAALGLIEGDRPTLMLKVDPVNITVATAVNRELRMIRTLDNPQGENVSAAELAETLLPSLVFFEDTFGARIESIFVGGISLSQEVADILHQQTGAEVKELAPRLSARQNLSGDHLPPSAVAGVAGALLG
jgi:type IV pilus assembly protein PilM